MKVTRVHRLLKLITMLQTGRAYRVRNLVSELRISKRTLFRDLNQIKHAGIPLSYDPSQKRYAIEKSFFLPPINFTVAEALALLMILGKDGPRTVVPNFEAIGGAMAKIENTLPRELQAYCGSALEHIVVRPPPTADASRTSRVFERLWKASQRRHTMELTYESSREQAEITTALSPYRLMFITRAWYVIGYSSAHEEIRTFKLDRITRLNPTGRFFEPDPDFSPAEYFGKAWQMIRGEKRYCVRICFTPAVARNVEEVLWHPTQQTFFHDDGSMLFEVEVDGLEEIVWWILGYGKEAVVEEPVELRKMIHEHIQSMSTLYGP